MTQAQPRSSLPMLLIGGLLMLVIGGAGVWFFMKQTGGAPDAGLALAPGEVFLEPAADVGPDPYVATPLAPTPNPTLAAPVVTEHATIQPPPQVSIQANSGSKPGLYGGSTNDAVCMVDQLVSFLGSHPDKASAWVAALNADPTLRYSGGQLTASTIPAYVGGLTPIVLLADTRVTNHGFVAGRATPRQSVLQKGTAVLVDPYGVPRARCYCGNPLLPPQPSKVQITYVGRSWADFNPAAVAVVSAASQPQTSFQVMSPTGALIQQPVGPGLSASSPVAGGTQPPVAASPVTTPSTVVTSTTAAGAVVTSTAAAGAVVTSTAAAGAVAGQTPYTVQPASDATGGISMPVPVGWETETWWGELEVAGQRVIAHDFNAQPSNAVRKDNATTYTQPFVTVRHVWPSTPGQPLDVNAVMNASKSTLCPQAGSPQPYSHPTFGSGTSVTYTGCQGNPAAEFQMVTFPQPDGSVVQVRMGVLEERDRSHIKTILDALTLPQVSAPAPPSGQPLTSANVPNAAGPMDVPVTNNTNEVLRIYWYDYNGQPDPTIWFTVAPGETQSILQTYEGAWFSAVALDGSTVATYQIPANGAAWVIP